jgi:hypothetical protein
VTAASSEDAARGQLQPMKGDRKKWATASMIPPVYLGGLLKISSLHVRRKKTKSAGGILQTGADNIPTHEFPFT